VELAADVGAELARRGHTLVSGGGSVSCMGAVAAAARAGGARTIGVIPETLVAMEVADTGADELLVTPDMRTRKALMEHHADAFLTLPGGIGTLEEFFEIWAARTLGLHDKPLVVLDPDGVFDPLREQLDRLAELGFVRAVAFDAVHWADTVPTAFDELERPAVPLRPTAAEVLEAEP
jgi:uncharacterized protein (TIGR00730 family)